MERFKKIWNTLLKAVFVTGLVVIGFLLSGRASVKVHAAGYVNMDVENSGYHDFTVRQKSGKYYFKEENYKFYISTSKNGPYQETPFSTSGFASNGKQAYYIKDAHYLYRYVYASGTSYYVENLPVSDPYMDTYGIATAQGNILYLTRDSLADARSDAYLYNIRSGKLRLIKRGCGIVDRYKNYVISVDDYQTGMGPASWTLYRLTGSGLKKVRNITTSGLSARFADGRLYFSVSKGDFHSFTFYSCAANGKGLKKVFSIDAGPTGMTYVVEYTSKYCKYLFNGKYYRYTYSTKKITDA